MREQAPLERCRDPLLCTRFLRPFMGAHIACFVLEAALGTHSLQQIARLHGAHGMGTPVPNSRKRRKVNIRGPARETSRP